MLWGIREVKGAIMDNQFEWVDFYKEFAGKLLAYKNNRKELLEKVKAIYDETAINMPTLEKDNQLVDIDPFTIFGLFNNHSDLTPWIDFWNKKLLDKIVVYYFK